MPDRAELGVVLRELRKARHLTLATVAHRAGCAESLVSYVESGRRRLHPWLASRLDETYRTGGVITALMRDAEHSIDARAGGVLLSDTLIVELPGGGVSMPLSRRELLASLGVGIAAGNLLTQLEKAIENTSIGDDTLQSFEDSYAGFQTVARCLPPTNLIDGLIGKVAVLDGLRRHTHGRQRNAFSRMQARFAESLSWLSEEAGDLAAAMYWIDRASQWGQAVNWHAISAYGFVRRSMVAISFTSDGYRAVDNPQPF